MSSEVAAPAGPAARRGRPPAFSETELIAVARRLGPHGLTLQSVAEALGVPRTTVYNRISGPEELGSLVLLSLLQERDPEPWVPADRISWQQSLESYARHSYDQLISAGPWLLYFQPEIHIAQQAYAGADSVIQQLVAEGLPPVAAGRALWFVCGVVSDGVKLHSYSVTGAPSYLQGSTLESYSWLAAARPSPDRLETAGQFDYALGRAIDGIEVDIQRHRKTAPRPGRARRLL